MLEVRVKEINKIIKKKEEREVIIRIIGKWIKEIIKMEVGKNKVLGIK